MKTIELTKGKKCVVDDEDFEALSQHKWYCDSDGYAARAVPISDHNRSKQKIIFMHREIAGTPDGFITDHVDGDKLNNRRGNLRICNANQNQWNRRKSKNNTTGFKGVDFIKNKNRYRARIGFGNQRKNLGLYRTAELAFAAYQIASKHFHGEFSSI